VSSVEPGQEGVPGGLRPEVQEDYVPPSELAAPYEEPSP
jgi:hypothetical protein